MHFVATLNPDLHSISIFLFILVASANSCSLY